MKLRKKKKTNKDINLPLQNANAEFAKKQEIELLFDTKEVCQECCDMSLKNRLKKKREEKFKSF